MASYSGLADGHCQLRISSRVAPKSNCSFTGRMRHGRSNYPSNVCYSITAAAKFDSRRAGGQRQAGWQTRREGGQHSGIINRG
jgi:hypothetical protein